MPDVFSDVPADPVEAAVLPAINRYETRGPAADQSLDRLTRLAARLFDVPYALISFAGPNPLWGKSFFGISLPDIPSEQSFCHYTTSSNATFVVEDARLDRRFQANPLVSNGHHVRFYAGTPIRTAEGQSVGTIAIMDTRPRSLSDADKRQLSELAEMVTAELEQRRRADRYRQLFESANDAILVFDPKDETVLDANKKACELYGLSLEELIGSSLKKMTSDVARGEETIRRLLQTGSDQNFETVHIRQDATPLNILVNTSLIDFDGRRAVLSIHRDVTDRVQKERRAEEALQQSEQKFRNIFEFAAIGIALADVEQGRIIVCNDALERMLGYSREELVGRSFLDITHPEDRATSQVAYADLVGGARRPLDIEKRYIHRDGSTVWARVMVATVRDRDGRLLHSLATIEDITPFKVALTAHRESEERFRAVTEHALDVIAILDEEASIVYISPSVESVLGFSAGEMMGRSSLLRVHPEDRPRVRSAITESLRHPRRPVEVTYRMQHRDESWRHFAIRGKNLLENPSIQGLLVNIRDVTEQKRIEAALRDSKESYRGLFEGVTDGIVVLDKKGRVLDINQGMLRQYGLKREEMIGRLPTILSAPDRNDFADLKRRLNGAFGGAPQCFEWWGRRSDGREFPSEVYFSAGRYFGQQVVIATARDITERIAYEQGLIEAKNEAEEMVRLKSAFLANMSHEIRTPLTTILGFTEILADEVDEPQREFVDLIRKGGRRLQETLMSVLDLARLEARSFALYAERLDVNEQVRGVCQLLEPLAREKGLWIRPVLSEEQVWAELDEVALRRVLNNLIGNAIKFSDNGGVEVRVGSDPERVTIEVQDTGIGIGKGFMPHLFEAFKQESEGLARAHEGSGLGLSISKHLIELMQGDIMVESEKGKGTTFSVTLPKTAGEEEGGRGLGAEKSARPNVLVIEDNVDTRTLLRYLLGREFSVVYAATGEEAVALATESQFDVLLVDINLGQGMSGEDVLAHLRGHPGYEGVPFVALTAYAMPGDRERFLELGFHEYMSKPFTKRDLMDKIRRLVAR